MFGAFQNQVGLVFGFLIAGVCGLVGAGPAWMAANADLSAGDLTPKRTLRVLRRDGEALRQRGEKYGDEFTARRGA